MLAECTIVCSMPASTMRDYVRRLQETEGLFRPGMVSTAVLALTALAFFRVALLPEFGRDLSMSTFQLGAVTTVFATGRLIADLPGGHLADRFPATRLVAVSATGVALGSALLASSTVLLPLYVATLLLGLCSATTNATGMTYFSNVGGAGHRGTSMAVFSAALLGGQAMGPAVAGLLASWTDWRFAMYVAAAAAAVVAVVLLSTSSKGSHPSTGDAEAHRSESAGPALGSMLVLQSVSFAVFLTLGSVPQTLVPVIGAQDLGLGAAAIGLALGAGGLSRFIGTLVGGRLSDRLSRKAALVPGLVVQGIGVGLLALRPTVVLWVAAIVVMSLASFAVPVAATILGDVSDPGRVGAQLGRFRFVGDLGLIAGPLLVTALYEQLGREVAFLFVAGLLILTALMSWRLLPETGRPGELA